MNIKYFIICKPFLIFFSTSSNPHSNRSFPHFQPISTMFSTTCGYKDQSTIKYTFTFIYEIFIFTLFYENFVTLDRRGSIFVALTCLKVSFLYSLIAAYLYSCLIISFTSSLYLFSFIFIIIFHFWYDVTGIYQQWFNSFLFHKL